MKTPQYEQYSTALSANSNISPGNKIYSDTSTISYERTQNELIRALYNGEGLDGLSYRFAEYMSSCVVIHDFGASLLVSAFPVETECAKTIELRQYLSVESSQNHRNYDIAQITQTGPVLVTDVFGPDTVYKLITPLEYSGECAGLLSIIRFNVPFSELELHAVTYAAGLFCVQLSQDKRVADIELRMKGNFVEDLISSHYTDPESILSRARALDYDIQAPHRVLVAEIENLSRILHAFDSDEKATTRFKTDLVQLMQNRLSQTNIGMVIYSKDTLILIVQQTSASVGISDFNKLAENIIEDVAIQFKAKMYIGIGSICTELPGFSKSYMEAKKALEIGEYMITEGQVRSFEQFKIHALFLSTLKPADLYNYARDQLEELLTYDEKHHTEFLKTLQEFLYLRNNVEGTAKSLNMSVSGLKYRLQKIEKIISLDLKDYKVCFDLQLALVILQLFGEYRIKEHN